MAEQKIKSAMDVDKYMAIKPADENGITFHSPFEEPFRLAGNYFQPLLGNKFRRLPEDVHISTGVDFLAWNTSGMQLAFKSNSAKVIVKAKLFEGAIMHHMPQTGSSSFDLYVGGPGNWRTLGSARFPLHDVEFSSEVFDRPDQKMREFLIDFPLYNRVDELWIGLDQGAQILPPTPWQDDRPLVVYGTSITQGGCASRPGLSWTNILSRWRNREVLNFGFSGSGRGEPEMAEQLSRVENPAAFVLDYEANSHYEGIKNTLANFIAILRKHHPETPIFVISSLPNKRSIDTGHGEDPETVYPDMFASQRYQRDLVSQLRAAGDDNITFINGFHLLGDDYDECMMDGCHLNDLGFYRMAEAMNKLLSF